MKADFELFQTVTAAVIFFAYCDHLQLEGREKDIGHIKTALLRFTVPGWSNVYPSGKKSTAKEVANSLEYLKLVLVEQFKDALAIQEKVFDHLQLDKAPRRQPRSILSQMLQWAESQGYFGGKEPDVVEEPVQQLLRLRSPKGQRRKTSKDVKVRHKPKLPNYALGTQPGDYFNDTLKLQLEDLVSFLAKRGVRPPTIQTELGEIKRLLGWLHRVEGISLKDLRLELIVPFTPIYPDRKQFRYTKGSKKGKVNYALLAAEKMELDDDAKEAGLKAIKLYDKYFDWRGIHPRSDVITLEAFVIVGKFLYQDQTDTTLYLGYEDIPVIKLIHNAQNAKSKIAKETPPTVPHHVKSIPWEEALEVIRKAQVEADLRFSPCSGRPLSDLTIARSIQKLLILLFFMANPPDRSRTFYELELGRTLVFGQRINGTFIPAERMETPEEAIWYLHLMPEDYKTGGTYLEVWDFLDDTPPGFLLNGKTFFDYLDLWLNQYRAVMKPTHNCVLTTEVNRPLNDTDLRDRVRDTFVKHTGIPVTPKELRKMYITYLKDSKATEDVLEGAAARQHHSRKMQSEVYDQQTRDNKVAPVREFTQQALAKAAKFVQNMPKASPNSQPVRKTEQNHQKPA